MGVLSDKIQSFIDSITNATTAMNDDVVAGKQYWNAGVVQTGTLLPVDGSAYSIDVAPNGEDIAITFSSKAYVIPTDVITIPKALMEEMFPEPEIPEESPEEPVEPEVPEDPSTPDEPEEPETEPEEDPDVSEDPVE